MTGQSSFTLSEVAVRLGVPQHRLIHLCEKGVVTPDLQDARGRGSSRRFSTRNYLEFGLALRMRELMMPVAVIGASLRVLRSFERSARRELIGFALPESLREDHAPDLRVIVGDGTFLYFSLGAGEAEPRLFGGIPLDQLRADQAATTRIRAIDARNAGGFGGPEGSRFGRLELSVTEVARNLALDRAVPSDR